MLVNLNSCLEHKKITYDQGYIVMEGVAYSGLNKIGPEEIFYKIKEVNFDESQIKKFLKSLTGFYGVIIFIDDKLMVFSDIVRSFPFFYKIIGNTIYLSNKASDLLGGDNPVYDNQLSCDQFLASGYVSGKETLVDGIEQTEAGFFLIICEKNNKVNLVAVKYYRFWNFNNSTEDCFYYNYDMLDKIVNNSIERLIDFAAGRKIIVPLSGGFDSRLIASKLKEYGYSNVLCFTYGRKDNNPERDLSEKIAYSLELDWLFIEYSDEIIKELWNDNYAIDFKLNYSNFCSLPHIQDWFAIHIMKKQNLIENDAIFVPGHSGDFVAGSHIPYFLFNNKSKNYQLKDVVNQILHKHYALCPLDEVAKDKIRTKVSGEILDEIDSSMSVNNLTNLDFSNLYECWDWKERQVKYIVNSIQVYKQFNYDFWLPLWDKEFVNFWQKIDLLDRKDRAYLKNYINEIYIKNIVKQNIDTVGLLGNASEIGKAKRLIIQLVNFLPVSFKRFLSKIYSRKKTVVNKHYLAFDALVDEEVLKAFDQKGYSLLGIYAFLYLKSKW
ncbi:asparagine synthase C-terminal domain-containing protein [Acinetobacter sp.]|uniref:asparagine synthase C-terminal domain-containing protein n=1 Tax=Acinetobacter sp. TaxID=472 RepID=UPI0031E3349C